MGAIAYLEIFSCQPRFSRCEQNECLAARWATPSDIYPAYLFPENGRSNSFDVSFDVAVRAVAVEAMVPSRLNAIAA